MTREEFIKEAKKRGYSKELAKAKYLKLEQQGAFDPTTTDKIVDYAKETAKNAPGSAGRLVSDTLNAVLNPIDTAQSMELLARGMSQKFHPDAMDQSAVPAADAAINMYKDRYGSVDSALETFKTDPFGTLSDFSMTKLIPKVGKYIPDTDIVDLGMKGMGKVVGKVALPDQKSQRARYQSGAKMSTTLPPEVRDRTIDTALKEGIMPTEKGMAKLSETLTDLNTQLNTLIDAATDAGTEIPMNAVLTLIPEARKRFEGLSYQSEKKLQAFDDVVIDFWNEHGQKGSVSPKEMQKLKKSIQDSVSYDVRKMKDKPDSAEVAEKKLATGAKIALEQVDPNIGPINSRMSDLINLQQWINNPTGRIGNLDILGLSPATGALISGGDASTLQKLMSATATKALDFPLTKTGSAIIAHQIRNNPYFQLMQQLQPGLLIKPMKETEQIEDYDRSLLRP